MATVIRGTARLFVTALALAGCHILLPYSAPPAPPSDASPREQAARDGASDGALADRGPSVEQVMLRDVLLGGEKPALDKPYPKTDGAPPPSSACAPLGNALNPYGSASMVHCDYSAIVSPISHCKAAAYCNAAGGWHVCTASEFLARGGATLPPVGSAAWIAACVRDNGAIHSASTAPTKCSACDGSTVLSAQVYWECDGATPTLGATTQANVGVHTYATCKRVGTNIPQNKGMWIAKRADEPSIHGVLCCWP